MSQRRRKETVGAPRLTCGDYIMGAITCSNYIMCPDSRFGLLDSSSAEMIFGCTAVSRSFKDPGSAIYSTWSQLESTDDDFVKLQFISPPLSVSLEVVRRLGNDFRLGSSIVPLPVTTYPQHSSNGTETLSALIGRVVEVEYSMWTSPLTSLIEEYQQLLSFTIAEAPWLGYFTTRNDELPWGVARVFLPDVTDSPRFLCSTIIPNSVSYLITTREVLGKPKFNLAQVPKEELLEISQYIKLGEQVEWEWVKWRD